MYFHVALIADACAAARAISRILSPSHSQFGHIMRDIVCLAFYVLIIRFAFEHGQIKNNNITFLKEP